MKTIFRILLYYAATQPFLFWTTLLGVLLVLATMISLIIWVYRYSEEKPYASALRSLKICFASTLLFFFVAGSIFYYKPSKPSFVYENTHLSGSSYLFGIDISHYQGHIDWHSLRTTSHPIKFVFIRATMGMDGRDAQYHRNWGYAKDLQYVRGAYHFYRPEENSTAQFENYDAAVRLEAGDFVPVLDIETSSPYGIDNLRRGVLNWLKLAEERYGVKPIVYTGLHFYQQNLQGYINGYPLWISVFNDKYRLHGVPWHFHQFTDQIRITGVPSSVDGNHFYGTWNDLEAFRLH